MVEYSALKGVVLRAQNCLWYKAMAEHLSVETKTLKLTSKAQMSANEIIWPVRPALVHCELQNDNGAVKVY